VLGETYGYRNQSLYCEETPLDDIARAAGTPCYVYSATGIRNRFRAYRDAFGAAPHTICYAVKANSNLEILRLLAAEGSGFDIVSGGELFRVLRAGGDPAKIVFSGVGKTREEIEYAIATGIGGFHCESEDEMVLIDSMAARAGKRVRIAFRVNPDIDARTHPKISTGMKEHKFGIDIADAEAVYQRALGLGNVAPDSLSCHIGSQMLDSGPILEAAEKMLALVDRLRAAGAPISQLDLGGGIGVSYKEDQTSPEIPSVIGRIADKAAGRGLHLKIEPGRSIVGPAGVLLTRVLYRKHSGAKDFVIVDAAMNDLIRPSLYDAHHEIIPVRRVPALGTIVADVVGPVCESGDYLALNREMANVMPGDLLAVCTAGAYGFVQASNYNSRPRPPEVLVDGPAWRIVRRRETFEDLIAAEV
jgi:diaminopimelate decarboxylase